MPSSDRFIRVSVPNRRHANRPHSGDTRRCPKCDNTSEFNERYRFDGRALPAWVCDRAACGYREFVRREQRLSDDAIRGSKKVRASAKRTMLKTQHNRRAKQTFLRKRQK